MNKIYGSAAEALDGGGVGAATCQDALDHGAPQRGLPREIRIDEVVSGRPKADASTAAPLTYCATSTSRRSAPPPTTPRATPASA